LEADGDALADPAQFSHRAALEILNRGLHSAKQKRARNSYPLERLTDDARLECADVSGDIREFRHE
jgi:hypothetical protein